MNSVPPVKCFSHLFSFLCEKESLRYIYDFFLLEKISPGMICSAEEGDRNNFFLLFSLSVSGFGSSFPFCATESRGTALRRCFQKKIRKVILHRMAVPPVCWVGATTGCDNCRVTVNFGVFI